MKKLVEIGKFIRNFLLGFLDTIVELTVLNKNKKQILRISTDMIGDEDAWKLLKAVFEKTGYNDYKDVYDFYGYELS